MTLYTIACSKCKILEKKLASAGVEYTKCEDVNTMKELGFTELPMLEVDGKYLNFNEAFSYIKNL